MKVIIFTGILAISISCINIVSLSYSHDVLIPDIGDTSSRYMSISQENKLGGLIYSQILGSFNLVTDPLVNNYIQILGNRLLMSDYNSQIKYKFLVTNDPTINAFVTPGGIIVINSGVILKTKTEAELASVIAHEIAHVKARHLSRTYEQSSQVNITTALSVLAAIFAGMYDSENIGKAVIGTQNVQAQEQVNFMRENEKEADRLSINILVAANINPNAMVDFFETLLRESNDSGALEFMRTHPITKNRIIETKNLASKYKGNFTNDSFAYQFVSARIAVNNMDTRKFVKDYIYSEDNLDNSSHNVINNYAYSLALIKQKKFKKAINILISLSKFLENKDKLYTVKKFVLIALADAYIKNNERMEGLSILEDLNNIYPTDNSILYYLSNAYIVNKDYKKTLNLLLPYIVEHKDHRLILKVSEAAYKLNEKSLGHEYRGDYLKIIGSFNSAIKFYKLAAKYNNKGTTVNKRIKSKIKEIEKLQDTKEIL